jgi:hypothetical protein
MEPIFLSLTLPDPLASSSNLLTLTTAINLTNAVGGSFILSLQGSYGASSWNPTNAEAVQKILNPTHGSGWIVQVQPKIREPACPPFFFLSSQTRGKEKE